MIKLHRCSAPWLNIEKGINARCYRGVQGAAVIHGSAFHCSFRVFRIFYFFAEILYDILHLDD